MEPKLIAGGVAAAGFAIVATGIGMLATRLRFRRPARPGRAAGCVAAALIALGGLVFAVAAIVLIAMTRS